MKGWLAVLLSRYRWLKEEGSWSWWDTPAGTELDRGREALEDNLVSKPMTVCDLVFSFRQVYFNFKELGATQTRMIVCVLTLAQARVVSI